MQCCPPDTVGRDDCAPEAPGWCFSLCVIMPDDK
jgi:hypothetical protein